MKLKDYLNHLNKLVESRPEILEMPVIYASDDEGNIYRLCNYEPSVGTYDGENFSPEGDEDFGEDVVCLN